MKPLADEKLSGNLAAKSFEAAGGIGMAQPQDEVRQQSKNSAHQLAKKRLMNFDDRPRRPAAADGDIAIGTQLGEEYRQHFNRHGQIGVREKQILPLSLKHASLNRGTFAAARRLLKDAQLALNAETLPDKCHGVIGAAVVDDEHLIAVSLRVAKKKDLLQTFADSFLFVIGWDDQRYDGVVRFIHALDPSAIRRLHGRAAMLESGGCM